MKRKIISFLMCTALMSGVVSGSIGPALPQGDGTALSVSAARTLDAPKNLRWSGTTAKWNRVSGASEYEVTLYCNGSYVDDFYPSGNSVNLGRDMKVGNHYYFTVCAIDEDGEYGEVSEQSESLRYTETDKSQIPSNLRWDGKKARWDEVEDAEGYHVELYRDGKLYEEFEPRKNYIDLSDYVDSKRDYTFRVRAEFEYDYGEFSKESQVYDEDDDVMPGGLRWDGFVAKWDSVSGAVGYTLRLYCDDDKVGKDIKLSRSEKSYDFSKIIKNYGIGDYVFAVRTEFSNSYSDFAESKVLEYYDEEYTVTCDNKYVEIVSKSGSMTVIEGEDFQFKITPKKGYHLTNYSIVKVNGKKIAADKYGVYTYEDVDDDLDITISSVEKCNRKVYSTSSTSHRFYCDICGVIGDAEKHNPENDDNDCTTALKCRDCGYVITAARSSHTGGTATCSTRAKCSYCGKYYGNYDKNNHESMKWKYNTSSHWGECSSCGVRENESKHSWVYNKTSGDKDYYICKCGAELVTNKGEKPNEIYYKVVFKGYETSNATVKSGAKIPSFIPKRAGYVFQGWYKDAGLTQLQGFNDPVYSDLTLYPKWTIESEDITPGAGCEIADEIIG